MTEGSDRGSCRVHDAHSARAALRGAGRQAWDVWLVCRAGEGATPAFVCPEYVDLADVVVAECPLVGDETAEYGCGRCEARIRKLEAVLYPRCARSASPIAVRRGLPAIDPAGRFVVRTPHDSPGCG